MLTAIIIAIILSLITIGMFIFDIFYPSGEFSAMLVLVFVITMIGWTFISYCLINRKRKIIFEEKIKALDKNNDKLNNLVILLDYIEDRTDDIDAVKKALEAIYFSPSLMRRHPEKTKKRDLYNLLIEYYLSLTNDKYKDSFFWDYNLNFFTWKCIGITSGIGLVGIIILVICQNIIPYSNDVLYTSLYVFFGALFVPLLAKFFGHII